MSQQFNPQINGFSKKTIWIVRICLLLLFTIWVGGACYLYSIVQEDKRELARIQQLQQQKEDLLRRRVAYKQVLEQQQNSQNQVKNAVDGVRQ